MSTGPLDAEVVVVGAGPAGVSAALMAASLRRRVVLVEPELVGGRLHEIGAMENAPGGWSNGHQFAQALQADVERLAKGDLLSLVRARATEVSGYSTHAELRLDDGRSLSAQFVVVATGVGALTLHDAPWIAAGPAVSAPPLWRAAPAELSGRTYVLGGDRPLGTWLRAHPEASVPLHVLCPRGDDYKIAEVVDDDRVRCVPVSQVVIGPAKHGHGWDVEVHDRGGARTLYAVDTLFSNLGSRPQGLSGLVRDDEGYCPAARQHPRIAIAGDLRSARYQRVVTAQGSGAEAVLAGYYADTARQ